MEFGKLLDEWERLSARPGGLDKAAEAERRLREASSDRVASRDDPEESTSSSSSKGRRGGSQRPGISARQSMENWLARHGVEDKDRNEERSRSGAEESRRLAALRPGARLDLHGMTVAEAQYALGVFLEDSARMGIEKVLVITGKGNHSASGAVLAGAARSFLEANPRAGRFGTADRADGGAGALWVLVRKSISRDR